MKHEVAETEADSKEQIYVDVTVVGLAQFALT